MDDCLSSAKRVLAMRLDNIGDMVMMTPALRSLRRALPQAEIALMASPAGMQAAPMIPWIDDMLTAVVLWQDAFGSMPFNPVRERRMIAALKAYRFDAALIFTSFAQSPFPPAYACYLAGIPMRAGQSQAFAGGVLSHCIEPSADPRQHETDRNLRLLEGLGVPVAGRHLELKLPVSAAVGAARLLHTNALEENAFIVVAPGASCQARTYPLDRYMQAISMIRRDIGLPVVILGGEGEVDAVSDALRRQRDDKVFSFAGRTSVPEFAALINSAAFVITNNSAAVHVADALGTPQVVLYSGTESLEQFLPRKVPYEVLNRPVSCAPCRNFKCPYNLECLEIPPEEVARAAFALATKVLFKSDDKASTECVH